MDESHENRLRIGINGLAQYLWRGPRDALVPASNLRTVLSTLHWSQLALETGSFSQSQLFHTYAHMLMHSQRALNGLWCLVGFKKRNDQLFFVCVPWLFITHEPHPSPRSPPLAV